MQSLASREEVLSQLEQGNHQLVSSGISAFLRSEQSRDSAGDIFLRRFLIIIQRHLHFLVRFDENTEPHFDENGMFHNRYDNFFTAWIESGAIGVDRKSLE